VGAYATQFADHVFVPASDMLDADNAAFAVRRKRGQH